MHPSFNFHREDHEDQKMEWEYQKSIKVQYPCVQVDGLSTPEFYPALQLQFAYGTSLRDHLAGGEKLACPLGEEHFLEAWDATFALSASGCLSCPEAL